MNNAAEDRECAEDYFYNCGYDGCYEFKEKAIIFECVGRGLKLPPLSQIYVPPFLLKGSLEQTENIRPSHHVLELLPDDQACEELNLGEKLISEPKSDQKNHHGPNDGNHSGSSDLDVYISDDDDDAIDECDSRPAHLNFQPQNCSEKKAFLPVSLVCTAEYSSTGNKITLNESGPAKNDLNEKDNSATSDEEIFSSPSYDEESGSDNEEVSVTKNNLNLTGTCSGINQNNSENILDRVANSHAQNIPVDKDLTDSALPKSSDPVRIIKHFSDGSNPSENLCSAENASSKTDERCRSSPNNYSDPVAEMFSSDEDEEDFFLTHFRTFKKQENLAVDSSTEFPSLPVKKTQGTKSKCQAKNVPGQLGIKAIAKLLLSNQNDADADTKSDNFEVDRGVINSTHPELLVIENLPQNINKECLGNFLQQFGKLEHITLIPLRDKFTAKVQYEIGVDLDWVVQCLDGSAPFGAESHILKCYRQ